MARIEPAKSPTSDKLARRLRIGVPLAAAIMLVVVLDAWLSELTPPDFGLSLGTINPVAWLMNGALSTAVVLVLTMATAHELVKFARVHGYRPFDHLAQWFAAGLVLGPFLAFNLAGDLGRQGWGMAWLAVALGAAFVLQSLWERTTHAMVNLALTTFVIVYAGGLAGYMTKLRMEVGGADGMVILVFSMFVVKMTDTGAYFVGSALGRHKMVPWLSPRKSWEGFFGGLAVAALSAATVGTLVRLLSPDWLALPAPLDGIGGLVLFGIVIGLFAVAGDLFASMLKRDSAQKDSGDTLGGLGGVLDVFDSPLLAAPAAWFFWTRLPDLIT